MLVNELNSNHTKFKFRMLLTQLSFIVFVQVVLCFITINSQLEENEGCVSSAGKLGKCLLIEKCPAAIKMIRAGGRPKICGFRGKLPVVCCENIISRISSIAARKCLEYKTITNPTTTTTTTTTTPRTTTSDPLDSVVTVGAIGGVDAYPLEFPHMAILGYGSSDDTQWLCGGSLISENFVLTAGHCIYSKYGNVSQIKLGVHELSFVNDFVQIFSVKRIHKHPKYSPLQNYHDIALIELDHPANIRAGVKPACLHTSKELPSHSFIGTGWGAIELYEDIYDILQKVNLSYVAHNACVRYYQTKYRLPNGLNEDWQMCADGGGKRADTCQGDSGGPLQLWRDGKESLYTIVGITSFALKCASVPGVYTRVSHYVPWIESVVWANS